jgi:prophage regulatory protein
MTDERIVREPECRAITGLSRISRWRMEREGTFPRHVIILGEHKGWLHSELMAWIAGRKTERDSDARAAG